MVSLLHLRLIWYLVHRDSVVSPVQDHLWQSKGQYKIQLATRNQVSSRVRATQMRYSCSDSFSLQERVLFWTDPRQSLANIQVSEGTNVLAYVVKQDSNADCGHCTTRKQHCRLSFNN